MSVRIRKAVPADAPGIRRLFERTFGKPLSQQEWEWKFERNPDGWFGTVAEDADGIVGNYCGWGMRFRVAGGTPSSTRSGTWPPIRELEGWAATCSRT